MNSQSPSMNSEDFAAPHLTEDDLDAVLIGIASPVATSHLAACKSCGLRLTAFQTQMANFNQATLDWSEQRSNAISRDLSAHQPTPRLTLEAIWSSAVALGVAIALGVAALHHTTPRQSNKPAIAQSASTPDQIAADNAMLAAIESEIDTPQPVRYGLYEKTKRPARRTAARQVRD